MPDLSFLIKKRVIGDACNTYGKKRGEKRILLGKPEGWKPLGKRRRRWEDNIKVDLQKVECGTWTRFKWFRRGTGGGLL